MSSKIKAVLIIVSLASVMFIFLSVPFSFKIGGKIISSVPAALARGHEAPEPSTMAVFGVVGLYFCLQRKIRDRINKKITRG